VEVKNPADDKIMKYFDSKGYEVETDKLAAEKTTYFLRLIVTLVIIIGLIISALSFYILMLSVFLLVQKNSEKLENLLLIGYSPTKVALPYQILTIVLNLIVVVIALIIVAMIRKYYMGIIETIFPQIEEGSLIPSIFVGIILLVVVSILNIFAIRRKILRVWRRK
jgi:cell division protein FtsX